MPAPTYAAQTEAAVALVAATPKTVWGVKAHANSGLLLRKLKLSSDGIASSAIPILVEVCYSTWATNSPGTSSTSTTPRQKNGRVLTAGFTSGRNWTSEPTALTVLDEFLLSAFMGNVWNDIPLGDEYDCALGEGFCARLTAPAAVNVRLTGDVNRC